MSCNGCRVLRKGCSDSCILRPCLHWIETPEAQGHATLFVAKFFGRAGLMSFISAVPQPQRPALFQSLLFEAVGRTINPVNGAVGLLSTGNWHLCQAAVETVFHGGALRPIPEFIAASSTAPDLDASSECTEMLKAPYPSYSSRLRVDKRRRAHDPEMKSPDLDLGLAENFPMKFSLEKRRAETPSRNSEESDTTMATCLESGYGFGDAGSAREVKLLNLF